MDNEENGPRTIGVAIGIPEPWAALLNGVRARAGDPAARQVPAHLTLLCPTEVAAGDEGVERHLAEVAARTAPFELWLRGAGTFRPVTPVVYVAVAAGAAGCARLAARVRSGPLAVVLRYPYHPHVTVAQQVPDEALDAASEAVAGVSARWRVESFSYYVRQPGGCWRTEREFRLTGRPGRVPRRTATPAAPGARVG